MTGAELKLDYDNGDFRTARFNPAGSLFRLVFDDEPETDACAVIGFDSSQEGDLDITVEYGGKTAAFSVTVVNRIPVGIEIITLPTKTVYDFGESLDVNGGEVSVSFDNGSCESARLMTVAGTHRIVFDDFSSEIIGVSGFSSDNLGFVTVTLDYSGFTAGFEVKIGDFMMGDADKNRIITVGDALTALRIAARLAEPTSELLAICDIDRNSRITVGDALSILRVAARLADQSSLEVYSA